MVTLPTKITGEKVEDIDKVAADEINEKEAYDYLKISFYDAYKHFNVTDEEKILFKKYHENFSFKPEPTLYLPVIKLLERIKASGGKNFIYTNRNETLYEYLDKFNITHLFEDFIISARKPDPTPLIEMINKHKLDKKQYQQNRI